MTKIASDAMIIQLAVDMAGDGEVQERLARLNEFIGTINTKAKAAAESVDMERMSVEGKYNPDIQRDYEIEKAIQLTNKLNLSLQTQDAILAEIEEKHRRANQLLTQQYSPGNMPGDDMVAAFRKNQEDAAKAEQELLAARQKAAKETEKLRDAELTDLERYNKKVQAIVEDYRNGIIDAEGGKLRVRAAKEEFEAIRQAAQDKEDLVQKRIDAEEKAAADEKALFAARLEALNHSLEEEHRSLQFDTDAYQKNARAKIEAEEKAARNDLTKQSNADRQKAIGILRSLEDATQRYARVADELRAHLEAGDITNEQYAMGLANIERRQRSMAGGANNVAYAIGNTVTGLEDFVTVLSITGFGMDGFAAATRAASNNVGQAVRSLGTASSAIAAPIVSIGMVLAGAAIPQIYNYITGAKDAEEATRKWEESLKGLVRTARLSTDEIALALERGVTSREISKMTDPEAIMDRMKGDVDKIAKLMNDIQAGEAELKATAQGILSKMIDGGAEHDFNVMVRELSKTMGGEDAANVEAMWRERFAQMQSEFITNAPVMGAEAAKEKLVKDMTAMQAEMQTVFEDLSLMQQKALMDATNTNITNPIAFQHNMFLNLFPDLVNDAAIIDQIQAVTEELANLNKEDTLEYSKKRKELESYKLELEQLQDQRAKALEAEAIKAAEIQAQAQHLDQQSMETELEKLKIQQHKNSLLGDENEAERKLFDLALKRKELMESGIAAPDVLAGLFNSELEAIAAELEKQIAKAEEVKYSAAAMTEPQAYTSANRQIISAMDERDTKLQEQIDLLKAIRDHLSGAATLQVEVM